MNVVRYDVKRHESNPDSLVTFKERGQEKDYLLDEFPSRFRDT